MNSRLPIRHLHFQYSSMFINLEHLRRTKNLRATDQLGAYLDKPSRACIRVRILTSMGERGGVRGVICDLCLPGNFFKLPPSRHIDATSMPYRCNVSNSPASIILSAPANAIASVHLAPCDAPDRTTDPTSIAQPSDRIYLHSPHPESPVTVYSVSSSRSDHRIK